MSSKLMYVIAKTPDEKCVLIDMIERVDYTNWKHIHSRYADILGISRTYIGWTSDKASVEKWIKGISSPSWHP